MYPVTNEFQERIIDMKNRKVFGRIEVDYTDVFLDETIIVTSNEKANVSYPQQTADNVKIPVGKILSLDGSCKFDGTYSFAPIESQYQVAQLGWWGKQLSNINGQFTVPHPTLSIEFVSRPLTRLNVYGDPSRKEYPVDFNIYLYNDSNDILYEENVIGNTSIGWEKIIPVITDISKMSLEITKWSHSGRQVKIMEFYTSIREVYEQEGIIDMKLLEQREVSGLGIPIGTVASNELTIKLDNQDRRFDAGNTQSPLFEVLRPNRRIKAYLGIENDIGDKEYVPLGVFWSNDWNAPENMAYVTTDARDRLKFLEESTYKTDIPMENLSLYDLAIDVLEDGGLSSEEYFVDEVLKNYIIPVVYIQGSSHREVLRLISEVSLGQVYCNRLGILRVEGNEPVSEIRNATTNEGSNISYPSQVVDEIEVPSEMYFILDGYSTLDGSFALAPESPEDGQIGWMGSSICDINGNFTTPYPKLTLTLEPKSMGMLKVVGDSLRGQYPVDYTITVKDINGNILSNKIIIGNNKVDNSTIIQENPTNAQSVELEITKWNVGNTNVKILEFIDMPYRQMITTDQYFKKNNPLKYNNLVNHIEVTVSPIDVVTGNILDSYVVVIRNEVSIIENGLKKFAISNPLIQTSELATIIGDKVLGEYSYVKRDLELEWRGNPALLLGDEIIVVDNKEENSYRVVYQELSFQGYLRAKINARRVIE